MMNLSESFEPEPANHVFGGERPNSFMSALAASASDDHPPFQAANEINNRMRLLKTLNSV